MIVAIAPNGTPIFECYKCGNRGTHNNGYKLCQIDGFSNRVDYHAVIICKKCREYLKEHKFPMKEL